MAQNSQLEWSDCTLPLGEVMGFYIANATGLETLNFRQTNFNYGGWQIYDNADLTTITFQNLTTVTNAWRDLLITNNAALTTVNFPQLVSCAGFGGSLSFLLNYNPSLTTITLPNALVGAWDFAGNALDSTSVNAILARAVANVAFTSGTLNLAGGTNAAPSGAGITDKATLIGRGCTVLTN